MNERLPSSTIAEVGFGSNDRRKGSALSIHRRDPPARPPLPGHETRPISLDDTEPLPRRRAAGRGCRCWSPRWCCRPSPSGWLNAGAVGGHFEKAFHYFSFKREEYLQHYHKRSNVESTFSMVKRKFGDAVRSKTDVAMVNEVLCKLLAHNLCVLIQEEHELGIESVFRKATS